MEPVTPRRYSTCCSRPCPALIGIVLTLVWISDSGCVHISRGEIGYIVGAPAAKFRKFRSEMARPARAATRCLPNIAS